MSGEMTRPQMPEPPAGYESWSDWWAACDSKCPECGQPLEVDIAWKLKGVIFGPDGEMEEWDDMDELFVYVTCSNSHILGAFPKVKSE